VTAAQSLIASAEIAEQAGNTELADFWRDMAQGALNLEGAGLPGLYDHWAREAATYAANLIDATKCRADSQCRCVSCRPSLIEQRSAA
jgi:hypothetical protein